jgi:SAM-dependent methyltransferase
VGADQQVRHPIFARFFERFAAKDEERGQAELRDELLRGLRGRVVEVGAGNGLNFSHYPREVDELVAVEPEEYLRERAAETARDVPIPITVIDGVAGDLPLDDGSFDAAVVSGVLCSVPDPAAALADLRRVLRTGGELRFYEHVRGRRRARARYQGAVALAWPRLMGGCHPNRDTLTAIERAGYEVEACRGFSFPPGARFSPVAPRILGVARSVDAPGAGRGRR